MKPFANLLKSLSPNCREASRLQSDALDRPLTFSQKLGLRIHLLLCKWCRRYGRQINFLRAASRHEAHGDHCLPPQELSPEARGRIKQKLATESDAQNDNKI